ncbi:MAG TPA: glycosyl hydrolase family 65 protein [Tepidisphaeraceae bacterium]|nr:glycosyl hydrolase family 65 protein [Tepidisphaeraceae bacterium]
MAFLLLSSPLVAAPAAPIPDDFPRIIVPGHQGEMDSLRALFYHHYAPAQPLIPLWDEWMPQSTLWPAINGNSMRHAWINSFKSRPLNSVGYVLTQQHDGTAHAEGWPFPLWQQGGGIGWHFAGTGIHGYDAPLVKGDNWTLTNITPAAITNRGWPLALAADAMASPPAFSVDAKYSPWLRLNWWATGLDNSNPYIEWTTADHPDFSPDRRVYFSPPPTGLPDALPGESRTMISMSKQPGWKGAITRLRIHFDNPPGAQVVIKSFHTAFDSRQIVNNLNFIRGTYDTFAWTDDYAFLRYQMPRLRSAMHYFMTEFQTRQHNCVYTTWPGHDGRSGLVYINGKKVVNYGDGIGGNYWDILPFGGEDALCTVYYYDTLLKLADLEEQIAKHPEWNIPGGFQAYDPADLRAHAARVKEYAGKRFWNADTGRFGTVDLQGHLHDYGFTFLNNEAIAFHFATADQAQSIRSWLDGTRIVAGDTSTGSDIYHWRFAPRSTTKRNLDYYVWAWSSPESIPFGSQVQDGGAVLGWSYYDLLSILSVDGPDRASERLSDILTWFDETQKAGGYRAYYADPSHGGSMQGGNVAGGLGLDREFFESVLTPNIILYGFLGLHPTPSGISINPHLPKDWPSLTITRIHLHDQVLSVTATASRIAITGFHPSDTPLDIQPPDSTWHITRTDDAITLDKN